MKWWCFPALDADWPVSCCGEVYVSAKLEQEPQALFHPGNKGDNIGLSFVLSQLSYPGTSFRVRKSTQKPTLPWKLIFSSILDWR